MICSVLATIHNLPLVLARELIFAGFLFFSIFGIDNWIS